MILGKTIPPAMRFGFFTLHRLDKVMTMKNASLMIGCPWLSVLMLLTASSARLNAQDAASGSDNQAQIVAALSSDDATKRWRAAKALSAMGSAAKPALPDLLNALNDENASVRLHSVVAIGHVGDGSDQVIKRLIQAVGDDDSRVRVAAATSISQLAKDPSIVVPLLVKMIETEDPLFASRIIETIVVRGEKAIPFLLEALKYERSAYWACLAIEEMGEIASPTVPALVDLLDRRPDDSLKLQALLAIAKIGPTAVAASPQVLSALSSDSSDLVHVGAAFASGVLGIEDATGRLQEFTGSEDKLLAMVSRWALAKLHPDDESRLEDAVNHLIEGLGSEDANIRLAAAEGLNALPADPALVGPKLVELLDESDPIVADNLAETFASMGEAVAERAGAALSNEQLRGLAIQVLGRLGPKAKSAVPQIVDALVDSEDNFRLQLQTVIRQIGPDAAAATDELLRSLDSDSKEMRIDALLALGNIGPGAYSAKHTVLPIMQNGEQDIEPIIAAWVIAKIAPTDEQSIAKCVPVLVKGLSFDDGRVQAEAAHALGLLGPLAGDAADALDALASDPGTAPGLRDIAKEAVDAVRP